MKLSIAYLSLNTRAAGLGRLDYETLLDVLPAFGNRLLIEGAAGSGKSTLLRWTAVEAAAGFRNTEQQEAARDGVGRRQEKLLDLARRLSASTDWQETGEHDLLPAVAALRGLSEIKPHGPEARIGDQDFAPIVRLTEALSAAHWRARLPFLIRLRHLVEELPAPEDLPNHLSGALGGPPENWVRDLLNAGDALLLIDGLDEVPEGSARESVLDGIEQYVQLYDKCTVIVASRPRTFDKTRFKSFDFVETEVDELTPTERGRFIQSWHRALAVALRMPPTS